MKRTAAGMVLLAALGGCTSANQGPDVAKRIVYDGRQPLPPAASPAWGQFHHVAASNSYAATNPSPRAAPPASPLAEIQPRTSSPAAPVVQVARQPGALPATLPEVSRSVPATPQQVPAPTEQVAGRIAPASGAETSTELKATSSSVPPPPVVHNDFKSEARPAAPLLPPPGELSSSLPKQADVRSTSPAVRMVSSKRFHLNYKVSDVGPSGVSAVDLWYTRDSRTWKKHDSAPPSNSPYIVEVSEEGLYGFTLLARNGVGLGKSPPQAGDVPQVWVEVDLTKPVVHLLGAEPGYDSKAQTTLIRWTAADKNFGPRPITLSYADQAKGPWALIAANVPNNGRYVWQLPANAPTRFFLRVEATDLAGNVAVAQSTEPVLIDFAQPSVSILAVEASGK